MRFNPDLLWKLSYAFRAADHPESVIVAAGKRLDRKNAPLTQIGIQFVQVGQDPKAAEFLRKLDDNLTNDHTIRDMIDTTPSTGLDGKITADILIKVLLGGINRRVDQTKNV